MTGNTTGCCIDNPWDEKLCHDEANCSQQYAIEDADKEYVSIPQRDGERFRACAPTHHHVEKNKCYKPRRWLWGRYRRIGYKLVPMALIEAMNWTQAGAGQKILEAGQAKPLLSPFAWSQALDLELIPSYRRAPLSFARP